MPSVLLLAFACNTTPVSEKDFTTVVEEEDTEEDTDTDGPADTDDPEDTGADVDPNTVSFLTDNVSCERLAKHTLTLTRLQPGDLNTQDSSGAALNVSDDLTAEFYEEKYRLFLGELSDSLENVYAEGQDSTEAAEDCRFSISLEDPAEEELTSIFGDEEGSGLKWAFYYPALYVGGEVSCSTSEAGFPCVHTEEPGATAPPGDGDLDPELVSGDFYDWASTVYFVYIVGDIAGSFSDMGFEPGWNLAAFDGGEIISVEPTSVGEEGDLLPIEIEIGPLLPRYSISATGSKPDIDETFGDNFTMGARPLQWLDGVGSATPVSTSFYRYSEVAWQLDIWGPPPESDHYFASDYDKSSDFFWQWGEYVDIAPEVPVVFDGTASSYDFDGILQIGEQITYQTQPIGALCSDADKIVFLYFEPADRPSETLWYSLNDFSPGWKAVMGTQGSPNTWRLVVENTSSSGVTYDSFDIGGNCTVDESWL